MAAQASSADNRLEILPGSIAGLKVEALAEAGEYTALAALAHTENNVRALGALAAASGESEAAFRWMWTIASSGPQPQRWEQVRRDLGEGIKVPDDLQDAVTRFVLEPVSHQEQQVRQPPQRAGPPDPRREVQALLLRSLDPTTPFARHLARSVLQQEMGRLPQDVRQAAFVVLGSSDVAADRELVFEHTDELVPRERLRPLAALSVPYSDGEAEKITETLREVLPIGQSPGQTLPGNPTSQTYWECARQLTARLLVADISDLLREPWTRTSAQLTNLLDGEFVPAAGFKKLKALLASNLGEPVLKLLLEVVSQKLPLEELAELGRFSHQKLSPDLSHPIRSRLSTYARPAGRRESPRSDVGERALAALRDFSLLCDDRGTAEDYGASLQTTELVSAARHVAEVDVPPWRLGRVARTLLKRNADAFEDDVLAASDIFADDTAKAAFLAGIFEAGEPSEPSSTGGQQPVESLSAPDLTFLAPAVLGHRRSIRVLAEAGYGYAIVAAAKQSDAPVREYLLVAEAAIGDLNDAGLEVLMDQLHWSEMDLAEYRRYATALAQRTEVLFEETEAALDSLSGPEAAVIAPDKLAVLLRTALDAGTEALNSVIDQPTEHLHRLFGAPSRPLHDLAREWAVQLPPSGDLVRLIVRTDETTVSAEEKFARVRRILADKIAVEAQSPANDWHRRGECLELASEADAELARQTALKLGGTGPADSRRRVAKVLADTESREGDEVILRRLVQEETNAQVREQLSSALRNITSGSVQRAVQNLRSLVGLDPDGGPAADVLLPDGEWHETFVANVDKARQRAGDPDAYIASLVMLTEFMVEQAVIARFEAEPDNGSAKEKEVDAMRRNRSNKPSIGALLGRQQAQSVFPWFNEAIVLRRLRNAHPSPAGSTRPLILGNEEVVEATALFRRILLGWEISMQDSA